MRLLKFTYVIQQSCRFRQRPRWVRPYLRDLYFRRLDQGPEPYRPRFAWPNWSWPAELSAFCHRVNEQLPADILMRVFTDKSFTVSDGSHISHNEEYVQSGKQLVGSCTLAFLRRVYPLCPEEWIEQIKDVLLSDNQLAFTSTCLGIKDLLRYSNATSKADLLSIDSPPDATMLAESLCALIAALAEHDINRAIVFIRDFLITPLVDLDVTGEIIVISNPEKLLSGVLVFNNRPNPDFRLQNQSSMNNLTACYQVGAYCDGELLGEAPGETLEIATQEAASQALRNLFGLSDHRPPLPLSGPMIQLDFSSHAKKNISIRTYLQAAARYFPQHRQPFRLGAFNVRTVLEIG